MSAAVDVDHAIQLFKTGFLKLFGMAVSSSRLASLAPLALTLKRNPYHRALTLSTNA